MENGCLIEIAKQREKCRLPKVLDFFNSVSPHLKSEKLMNRCFRFSSVNRKLVWFWRTLECTLFNSYNFILREFINSMLILTKALNGLVRSNGL